MLSLIIHNVRSAYNVGSMFRTADGAGVDKIYICGYSPIPLQGSTLRISTSASEAKIAKTALGAQDSVPWEYHPQTWRLLKDLKAKDTTILALEQHPKSIALFEYLAVQPPSRLKNTALFTRHSSLAFSVALLVGNEVKGLSPSILKYVDDILEIPMHGKKESLNVAVATGIALYQLNQI